MKNIKKLIMSLVACLTVTANVVGFAACQIPGGSTSQASEEESSVAESSSVETSEEESSFFSEEASEIEEESSAPVEDEEIDFSTLGHTHVWVDGVCEDCALELLKRDGKYIYFGEYPQTLKDKSIRVAEEASENGYYIGEDGAYYAKVVAKPYTFEYTFTTGDAVVGGESYYFKVEPIRWIVLEENESENTAKVLCDNVLMAMAYQHDFTYDKVKDIYYTTANGAPAGTYANNYKYSAVRKWLNDTFYSTAFDEMQQSLIQTMLVDNSAATTTNVPNPYACENTEDKVTLPSFADTINTAYGFRKYPMEEDLARTRKTSDYARALGAWMSTNGRLLGNGTFLLRSPHFDESSHVMQGERSGKTNVSMKMDKTDTGVVPMITIKLG